jgi:hypothetical protein
MTDQPPSKSDEKPLFRVSNGHGPDCGQPPSIDGNKPNCRYSYFQNEYGEQAIFEYNLETKVGTFWMGDDGWNEPHIVRDGRVPELGHSIEINRLKR